MIMYSVLILYMNCIASWTQNNSIQHQIPTKIPLCILNTYNLTTVVVENRTRMEENEKLLNVFKSKRKLQSVFDAETTGETIGSVYNRLGDLDWSSGQFEISPFSCWITYSGVVSASGPEIKEGRSMRRGEPHKGESCLNTRLIKFGGRDATRTPSSSLRQPHSTAPPPCRSGLTRSLYTHITHREGTVGEMSSLAMIIIHIRDIQHQRRGF